MGVVAHGFRQTRVVSYLLIGILRDMLIILPAGVNLENINMPITPSTTNMEMLHIMQVNTNALFVVDLLFVSVSAMAIED